MQGRRHGRSNRSRFAGSSPSQCLDCTSGKLVRSVASSRHEQGWAIYADSKACWIAGDLEHTHPGGESYADIRRRVVPLLDNLSPIIPGETVVVGRSWRGDSCYDHKPESGDFQPVDFDRLGIDFASVNELLVDGTAWTAGSLNRLVAPSGERPVA